jgi:predicted  nucleic acid-binding Zn-ribbon protein
MKCKKKQEMVNTENVKTKNGNSAVKGECKKCGTKMFVILPKSKPVKSTKSKKSVKSTKSKKSVKSKKSRK